MQWDIDKTQSDNYLSVCKQAAAEDMFFDIFKMLQPYQVVLEHLIPPLSDEYAKKIKVELTPELLNKFRENDLYGSPYTYDHPTLGKISPSTVRYVKQASDIRTYFEESKLNKIVEVGGGYGGLCKTISCLIDFDEYVIIDQPEANLLSEKYLSKFPELQGKIRTMNCFELETITDVDLFVSNYALSELTWDSQFDYYNKVIANSRRYYVTNNSTNQTFRPFIMLTEDMFSIFAEPDIVRATILFGTEK